MSFFDDDDFEEPTHVADAAPPRASRRPRGFSGFGGGGTSGGGGGRAPGQPDPHTARVRQMVALGIIVVVLILLAVGISSCVSNGRTSALKDYSRDVTALLVESRDDVGVPLFRTLSSGGQANELTNELNTLRDKAEQQADRAKGFSPPGDDRGQSAQHDLELAMNFRAQAVRVIASRITAAQADQDTSEAAVKEIAGQMQALVASDVILLQRTKPLIDEALKDADVTGADVQAPRFVTDMTWLEPDTVASKLGGSSTGSSGGSGSTSPVRDRSGETPATTGAHGNGIVGVTMGGTALEAGTDATVTGRTVEVQVANQGEADEANVDVGATFTPSGGKAAFVKKTVKAIPQGQTVTVQLALPSTVKAGQAGELVVEVGGVPGEQKLDNNKATYTITIGE